MCSSVKTAPLVAGRHDFNPTSCLATRAVIYRSFLSRRVRSRNKVSKRVFWGVCRKVTERPEKVKYRFSDLVLGTFWTWEFFGTFLQAPNRKTLFETFIRFRDRKLLYMAALVAILRASPFVRASPVLPNLLLWKADHQPLQAHGEAVEIQVAPSSFVGSGPQVNWSNRAD